MKTSVQKIIDYLQEMLDDDFDSRTKYIQEFCEKALIDEKQQIIEACIKTTQDCWTSNAHLFCLDLEFTEQDLIDQKEEAEQYYNETFN